MTCNAMRCSILFHMHLSLIFHTFKGTFLFGHVIQNVSLSHPIQLQSSHVITGPGGGGAAEVTCCYRTQPNKKKKKKNPSLQTYPFRGKKKGPAKKKPKTRKRRKGEQSRHKNETQHYWDKVNTIIKKHKKMEDGKQKQKWKQKWK